MLNMPVLKFEKSCTYIKNQVEIQTNNKHLLLEIIANIGLILEKTDENQDTSNYRNVITIANSLLERSSDNVTSLEQLNLEVSGITKELTDVLMNQSKNSKSKEYYIATFSNLKRKISDYTEKFKSVQTKVESDNRKINDFINVNNFRFNVNPASDDSGSNFDVSNFEFGSFSVDNNTGEIVDNTETSENVEKPEESNESPVVENVADNEEVNEVAVEETPVEDVVEEEAFVEEAPVEDVIEEESSVEEAPVEENAVSEEFMAKSKEEKIDELTNQFKDILKEISDNNLSNDPTEYFNNFFKKLSEGNAVSPALDIIQESQEPQEPQPITSDNDIVNSLVEFVDYSNAEENSEEEEKLSEAEYEQEMAELNNYINMIQNLSENIESPSERIEEISYAVENISEFFKSVNDKEIEELPLFQDMFKSINPEPESVDINLFDAYSDEEPEEYDENAINDYNTFVDGEIDRLLDEMDKAASAVEEQCVPEENVEEAIVEESTVETEEPISVPEENNIEIVDDRSMTMSNAFDEFAEMLLDDNDVFNNNSMEIPYVGDTDEEEKVEENNVSSTPSFLDIPDKNYISIDLNDDMDLVSIDSSLIPEANDLLVPAEQANEQTTEVPQVDDEEIKKQNEDIINVMDSILSIEGAEPKKESTDDVVDNVNTEEIDEELLNELMEATDFSDEESIFDSEESGTVETTENVNNEESYGFNESPNPLNIEEKIEKIKSAEADNETLIFSKTDGHIYLPYKIVELITYLENYPDIYKSLRDVVESEFILPIDYFSKNLEKSRYNEAYNLYRNRAGYKSFDAFKIANRIKKISNLNPAIIASCRSVNDLEQYIYFLRKNELDKFKTFNIIYLGYND